jgi:hypothetical protein
LAKEKRRINKEANRMMKLSLTDGLNKLEAIEYERINHIEYFALGSKLLIKPPVEVRRGILMLKPTNVD